MSTNDLTSADVFDVDAWIDAVQRPQQTVLLYPAEADYLAKVTAIEAQIPAAEKDTDRGVNDPSPEALYAQLQELKAAREAGALAVTVRQLSDEESFRAAVEAREAGVTDPVDLMMWGLAATCVEPKFTGPQLCRLRDRDRSGYAMVTQLLKASNEVMAGPQVPSSPER